ncbi:pirin domain-containing protein [Ceratobasidium sp. AG-Ba]|nr:pirin domain-containing protein [Ceratobasidium sp. AG-Ba]QRW03042.1 pirin domain-containing protein [Ceratobasidium sp. AG-Ba]
MILDHGRSQPYVCLQKTFLEFTISRAIQELARGINALDMYNMLEANPPLPLQMCFDDLNSQLCCHLTESFPALFGAHATSLQKNTSFLSSGLDSMFRIIGTSADGKRRRQADLARQHIEHHAGLQHGIHSGRVGARALKGSDTNSGSNIKSALPPAARWDRDDLARRVVRRMYYAHLKILPQEKRIPVIAPETEEVIQTPGIMADTTVDGHAFIDGMEFPHGLDVDEESPYGSNEEIVVSQSWNSIESALETESPFSSYGSQEPLDAKGVGFSSTEILDFDNDNCSLYVPWSIGIL